jgi:hypothetical protein
LPSGATLIISRTAFRRAEIGKVRVSPSLAFSALMVSSLRVTSLDFDRTQRPKARLIVLDALNLTGPVVLDPLLTELLKREIGREVDDG